MANTPEKSITTIEGNQEVGDGILSSQERDAAEAIRLATEKKIEGNTTASNHELNKTMLQEIDKHFIMPRDGDKNKTEQLRDKEATQKFYDYMIYDIGSYYLLKSKDVSVAEDKQILNTIAYFLKLKNPDLYNNPQSTFARDFSERPYRTLEQYFKNEYKGTKIYKEKIGPEVQTNLTTTQKDALTANNTELKSKGLSTREVTAETTDLTSSNTFATRESTPIRQEFYMSKNTPEDNKTIENQLINIKNQLNTLKANTLVNPDSIKVVIRSSASNMYYDGEFKDNPGLAAARANTAETLVLNSDIAIPADNIMKESSVNGPVYPPTQADLDKFLPGKGIITANYQQHLDEIEAAIYRPYQYVQVALQYQEKQPEPRFTVQKESDFKNEVEGMYTRGTTNMIVEKDGKYFNLQLSHNIGSKAQRDWFPITKTEFDGYMKKVGSNTEVNKNQVNKNDYYSKRPIILIPSNQYEAITKKFIGEYKNGKLAKPADYTDKWLDQEVNDMLKLVDDTKKKGSSDRSSITFDPTPFGQ